MLDFGDALKIKGNYLDFEHTEEKRIPVIIKKPNGKGII